MAVLLGMITAVGGGVIRDIFLNRIPVIFEQEIYASAALAGALVVVAGNYYRLPGEWMFFAGFSICFYHTSSGSEVSVEAAGVSVEKK